MPCYSPLKGYYSRTVNPTGKRSIVFSPGERYLGSDPKYASDVEFACSQCIGCRIERSRQWAIRCVHEAQLHEENCFITLTYNPQHLPADGSLHLDHFQNFMKRFRMIVGMGKAAGIRFFHCGEYGETFERPHYHALIFGFDFPDKVFYREKKDIKLYTSGLLDALWSDDDGVPLGFSTIGNVTFESAAYCARYIMEKVTGENADGWYAGRKPEYVTMSRRPGIASEWFSKYKDDVFPSDEVILRGKKLTVPKFYGKLLESDRLFEFERIKAERKAKALKRKDDNTFDRLRVREQVKISQLKQLKRGMYD